MAMGGATEKVMDAVENNGGIVVTFENCSGAKSIDRLIDEYKVDGVLEMTLQACHTYNDEMFELACQGSDPTISSMCTVFEESEVTVLIGKVLFA